jgi:hypothetical protein
LTLILFVASGSWAEAASYFVKNGGSDAADGLSDANAWANISKVNSTAFSAGDTINFRRGSTSGPAPLCSSTAMALRGIQ